MAPDGRLIYRRRGEGIFISFTGHFHDSFTGRHERMDTKITMNELVEEKVRSSERIT